jgi:hypothetical protein
VAARDASSGQGQLREDDQGRIFGTRELRDQASQEVTLSGELGGSVVGIGEVVKNPRRQKLVREPAATGTEHPFGALVA